MSNMFKCLSAGVGKTVNKKQVQDFIKELLFEKSLDDLSEIVKEKYAGMPGMTAAIFQSVHITCESGDFSKLKPVLDFAFEKEARPKTGAKK